MRGLIRQKDERLFAKDDQLSDYKERLGLAPRENTSYSKLTHTELKVKNHEHAAKLRVFIDESDVRCKNDPWSANSAQAGLTKDQRTRLALEFGERQIKINMAFVKEYGEKFKSVSMGLREELLSRLPKGYTGLLRASHYENMDNPLVARKIADDLDKMANSLP